MAGRAVVLALAVLATALACGEGRVPPLAPASTPTRAPATATPTATIATAEAATASPSAAPASPTPTPTPSGPRVLLPNLRPLPPDELYIQSDEVTGRRELRFSTLVANIGEGRLVMNGTLDAEGRTSEAVQILDDEEGGTVNVPVGSFVFHDIHQHWHFVDFMVFELWTHQRDGRLDRLLATTGKMTFCIVDNVPVPFDFPAIDQNPLASLCGSDLQGISVGWVDIYAADVPGQDLDLGDLPDGPYAVRTRIDPDGQLLESDRSDNEDITYVFITGFDVEAMPAPPPIVAR